MSDLLLTILGGADLLINIYRWIGIKPTKVAKNLPIFVTFA